jgi:hypothetical protein
VSELKLRPPEAKALTPGTASCAPQKLGLFSRVAGVLQFEDGAAEPYSTENPCQPEEGREIALGNCQIDRDTVRDSAKVDDAVSEGWIGGRALGRQSGDEEESEAALPD